MENNDVGNGWKSEVEKCKWIGNLVLYSWCCCRRVRWVNLHNYPWSHRWTRALTIPISCQHRQSHSTNIPWTTPIHLPQSSTDCWSPILTRIQRMRTKTISNLYLTIISLSRLTPNSGNNFGNNGKYSYSLPAALLDWIYVLTGRPRRCPISHWSMCTETFRGK